MVLPCIAVMLPLFRSLNSNINLVCVIHFTIDRSIVDKRIMCLLEILWLQVKLKNVGKKSYEKYERQKSILLLFVHVHDR